MCGTHLVYDVVLCVLCIVLFWYLQQRPGLLFLFYSTVNMIFWRVFMRISYSCPAHLKFLLTVEKWTELVQLTSDAIDWLDANDRSYDVWLLVAYCATSCALVQVRIPHSEVGIQLTLGSFASQQYHTWARRKDQNAQAQLRKLRDCVRKWEGSLSPDHMSTRRKAGRICPRGVNSQLTSFTDI